MLGTVPSSTFLLALLLTIFAGLATGLGGVIVLFSKRENRRPLAVSLGFSAGVMIYVAFVEILAKARTALSMQFGEVRGYWVTVTAFFAGIVLIALIDRLVPKKANPHEMAGSGSRTDEGLMRMGMLAALAIAIHNFPEGLATFMATLKDPRLGIAIATAIAIHNIPEGIAVAMPVFHASGSRKRAFFLALLSGLAEPVGAVIGYLVFRAVLNDALFGIAFALVAGIMVFISLDELLPAAETYGEHHLSIYGLVAGMGVMALSLLLFAS